MTHLLEWRGELEALTSCPPGIGAMLAAGRSASGSAASRGPTEHAAEHF